MEMAQPHRHQTSVVDTFVKTTAMSGAFRILEQINEGSDPEEDAYINIEVDDDDAGLHDILARLSTLFDQCGGPSKAFSSSAMRRNLAPLAGRGGLQKHDFDTTSQRWRTSGSTFSTRDHGGRTNGSVQLQPQLRFFEFINMLKQLGARAFPGQTPRETLESILSVL